MKLWKQISIAGVAALVAALAAGRLYPGSAALLSSAGFPPALVAILSGGSGAGNGGGPLGGPGGAPGGAPGGGPPRAALVKTAPVETATINDRITAIGDGGALRSVAVVPLVSGMVKEVMVRSGDRVKTGQVLARLDSEAEKIARDRAVLAVQNFKDKVDRTEQLAAMRAASEVQLGDARNEYQSAILALRDAEIVLARRTITSPIDGVAGIVDVEVGDYVTTEDEIVTIDNRSALVVDFWVPERFAALIEPGQEVEAAPIAAPGRVVTGTVTAVATRVEAASRTLQVRARIGNSGDALRPGMSFRVTLKFPGETFPSVDPLAIQWSSTGAFVWKATDGKAQRIPVRIVQRNSDAVLVDATLAPGDEVITEGVQSLREGAELNIANSGAGQGAGGQGG
jgi:RND family efflux transporter MFP subunit